MPARRYVILRHDWPTLHWDLMLEEAGSLLTWRIFEEPRCNTSLPCSAAPNHRLHYLDYVGSISENRGSVQRWDAGSVLELQVASGLYSAILSSGRFASRVEIAMTPGQITFRKIHEFD